MNDQAVDSCVFAHRRKSQDHQFLVGVERVIYDNRCTMPLKFLHEIEDP
jgi:hypothetical protein